MKRGAVLIGVGDTAGAYRSVIGGADHGLWLSPRRDLCQGVCLQLARFDRSWRRKITAAIGGGPDLSWAPLNRRD